MKQTPNINPASSSQRDGILRIQNKKQKLFLCFSLAFPFHVLGEMVLHKGGYLRFKIPRFVIDDMERERPRIPVTLQGSLADLQHHTDLLIVQ